jgi:hypothetical protein
VPPRQPVMAMIFTKIEVVTFVLHICSASSMPSQVSAAKSGFRMPPVFKRAFYFHSEHEFFFSWRVDLRMLSRIYFGQRPCS